MIVIPLFFKDEMLTRVKQEINNNVTADVEFKDFRVSLFKSFPDLNLGLHDLVVTGINKFDGDTLVYFESFNVQVNLISAIKKNIVVKGIVLNEPLINGKVLEDSTANWDIAMTSEELSDAAEISGKVEPEVDTEGDTEADYRIDLQKFQIIDAKIKYTDYTSNLEASLDNLNFLLKGDFGMDYSDLSIYTTIDAINVKMGAIKYLKDASFGFDATIGADMKNMAFTFKDNELSLNDIVLGFDGTVEMPEEDIHMDVTFDTRKTSFKSLLSMIPAIYMQDFEELKASGKLALNGSVKGTYNEEQMPLAKLRLVVENAMFQYPDLPKSVDNVNVDLSVFYDGVNNDNTTVDLDKFHLEMAGNPFDIAMHIRTPFSDPEIKGSVDGHVVLNTLSDALPLEDVSLTGEIAADIDIDGKMSTIENENYEDFQATGKLVVTDFLFESDDLPASVKIIETTFNFSPKYLELESFQSKIGDSDFSLNGKVENYISYALNDGTLKGNLYLNSNNINANQFITEEEPESQSETDKVETDKEIESSVDTVSISAVEIPERMDIKFISQLNRILYDQMEITDLKGTFLVKDQKLMMDNLNMNLLDGKLGVRGEYSTQDIEKPAVAMSLNIQDIEIESALNSFIMLESLAPILKNCKGKVSIQFDYKSLLDAEMSPVLSSIDGYGRLQSEKVQVVDSKTLDKLSELLKLQKEFNNEFTDIDIRFSIKDGRITVEPFDLNMGDIKMTVGGSHGIDQTLDYNLDLDIPRDYLGSTANKALEGLLGEVEKAGVKINVAETIAIKAKVVGTTTDPKITLNYKKDEGAKKETGIKEELKEKVKQEIEKEGREELKAQADKIVTDAEEEAAQIKKEARVSADKVLKEANQEADALVKEATKEGMLAKIAAEKAADKLKAEAKTKADKIIAEADKKAANIVAEAKVKAADIEKKGQ